MKDDRSRRKKKEERRQKSEDRRKGSVMQVEPDTGQTVYTQVEPETGQTVYTRLETDTGQTSCTSASPPPETALPPGQLKTASMPGEDSVRPAGPAVDSARPAGHTVVREDSARPAGPAVDSARPAGHTVARQQEEEPEEDSARPAGPAVDGARPAGHTVAQQPEERTTRKQEPSALQLEDTVNTDLPERHQVHDFRPKPETEIRQVDKVVPVQQLSNDFSRQPERQTKKRTPQCDREDSESDDVSERRRQKGQAETDIKAGTTQHSPSKKSKSASQNVRHRTADRTSRHKKRRLTSTTGSTSTEGERRDRKSSTAKEDEPYPPSDAGVDSSSEEEVVPPKHMMKPPKFDGLCSFETFMVQFSNCADYNKWTEAQKLAHLRNSLEKDVANILWDYGTETTTSWRGLTEILETRFGGKAMSEKYRLELRHRRRLADETLQSLHRRLAALAYNGMTPEIRDPVTCDHFLDALGDPELAFKIRERQPADVDSALRIALRLEVLAKELTRDQDTEKGEERRVRAISNRKPRTSNGGTYVNSYRRPEATRYIASSAYSGPRPASYNNRAKSV